MKSTAIIAEYNPFHNGHLYQINKAREKSGADFIVVIMSGDFVQRGEPACLDKYKRTQMALECGADLVLELPCIGALSSAELFAYSGVALAQSTGADHLCFGCENTSPETFEKLALILADEPERMSLLLKENLRSGKSYPAARADALKKYLESNESDILPACSDLIRLPNNILSLEYYKAIVSLSAKIKALPIQRIGNDYNDMECQGNFVSAGAIRKILADLCSRPDYSKITDLCNGGEYLKINDLYSGTDFRKIRQGAEMTKSDIISHESAALTDFMPAPALSILNSSLANNALLFSDDFTDIVKYSVYREKGKLDRFADVNADLANRLESLIYKADSLSHLSDLLKNKSLTASRIRRCLFHIALGHTKSLAEGWKKEGCSGYANVLGFRKGADKIFTQIDPSVMKGLVMRSAQRNSLTGIAKEISDNDIFASEIYRSVLSRKTGISMKNIMAEPLIVKKL